MEALFRDGGLEAALLAGTALGARCVAPPRHAPDRLGGRRGVRRARRLPGRAPAARQHHHCARPARARRCGLRVHPLPDRVAAREGTQDGRSTFSSRCLAPSCSRRWSCRTPNRGCGLLVVLATAILPWLRARVLAPGAARDAAARRGHRRRHPLLRARDGAVAERRRCDHPGRAARLRHRPACTRVRDRAAGRRAGPDDHRRRGDPTWRSDRWHGVFRPPDPAAGRGEPIVVDHRSRRHGHGRATSRACQASDRARGTRCSGRRRPTRSRS